MMSHRPALCRRQANASLLSILCLLLALTLTASCTSTYARVKGDASLDPAPSTSKKTAIESAAPALWKSRPALWESRPGSTVELIAFGPRLGATSDDAFMDPKSLTLSLQRNESLEVHGSIWFHFGRRFLEDTKSWKPIEEPTVGGFEVMYEFVKEFPIQVEFGFQYAKKEDEDETAGVREQYESLEIYLGLRQDWDINFFATHLYVGGGISFNWMDAELQDGTGGAHGYEDQVIGVYLHTGFYVPLGTYLVMGIDLRGMMASDYQLGPNSMGSNYAQGTVFGGFAW